MYIFAIYGTYGLLQTPSELKPRNYNLLTEIELNK